MCRVKLYCDSIQAIDDSVYWWQINGDEWIGLQILYVKLNQDLFWLGKAIQEDKNLVQDCNKGIFFNRGKLRCIVNATNNGKHHFFKYKSDRPHKYSGKDIEWYRNQDFLTGNHIFKF